MRTECCQEPDNNRCQKYNRKCSLKEIFCLIPQKLQNILGPRHSVIRQLHNERYRIPFENTVLRNHCHQNTDCNTAKIKCNHNQSAVLREKCRRKKSVNRQFGGTAHKRNQHDRHLTVTFRWQGSTGHNPRYWTPKADQQRYDTSSRKTDLSQQLIHNKSHSGHVTCILQKWQEKEQRHDDRQEA